MGICWNVATVGLALSLLAPATAGAREPKHVLALFDYDKDAPANAIWDSKLRETLAAGPETVEYYAEYYDAARFSGPAFAEAWHDYLERKYADKPIDVIVAMDLTSRFLAEAGSDLFVDVPVVHTVGMRSHPAASQKDRMVGIRGVFDARRTVELALDLHPGTTEVFVVSTSVTQDGFFVHEVRRQLVNLEHRVGLTYIIDLPIAQMLQRVTGLGPHALVLFVVAYDPKDPVYAGRYPGAIAAEIARVSGAPVYGLYSSYLRGGVVGGYVYSLEDGAALAAKTALRILAGERPRDLPALEAPIVPMFDWRELEHFGIDEAKLPTGSRILFRVRGAWETYGKYVVAALAVLGLELALIAALLVERRGRRRTHAELVQRIAERERAEAELREHHERLRKAQDVDRRKDEFLATLGHELRNPLAPIAIAVEVLRERPDERESVVWARDMIGRQVTMLTRLVDDLLDVSRFTLGKVELRKEPLDLGAVAQQALEARKALFAERKLQVRLELPVDPVVVRGDAVRLTQVISNLLHNAAKYTSSGGHVTLRVAPDGDDAVVAVTDTGVGIPADMIEQVFDPFTQVASARRHAHGGLGIGLTLVKRTVEMHGGSVHAASGGEARGSEFVVRLPALTGRATDTRSQASPPTPVPVAPASRRILVVDDNVDAAESLRRALTLKRHAVEVAHDGLEAVDAAARLRPDVVLLDLDLPKLDGIEVARKLRQSDPPDGPRLLLVATTGLGREVDRARTREVGFDHHLVKPIDLRVLEALLRAPWR